MLSKKQLPHIIAWSVVSVIKVIMYNKADDHFDVTLTEAMEWWSYTVWFYLGIFYSFYLYFIPKYLGKRDWLLMLIFLLTLAVYPFLKMKLDEALGGYTLHMVQVQLNDPDAPSSPLLTALSEYFRRMLTPFFLIPLAFLTRLSVDRFKHLKLKNQLEAQNLKSELALLRSQVNPHFLFNTLNNIDSMVYKAVPEASEAIMKLSGIMRYMLYESNADKVPLEKEISYIKSFIGLQQIRLTSDKVVFDTSGQIAEQEIAPMLLIPFVENAFKHGGHQNGKLSIHMELKADHDHIHFTVINNVDQLNIGKKDSVGGVGLPNVKRRLELLYPNKHQLSIEKKNNEFKVDLRIRV